MKTKIFTLSLFLVAALAVNAQEVDKATVQAQADAAAAAQGALKGVDTGDKAWKFSGSVGLNAAATGLWNWAAGGNNNVNGLVYTHLRLLYHKDAIAWDSNLDMEYGLSWIDQEFDALQKSSDKLNFQTKFGWEFKEQWYLTVLAGFQSQFANGRNYGANAAPDQIISRILAPSYTDISVGIDWKPNDIFSIYLSPVAGRITTAYVPKGASKRYAKEMDEWNAEPTNDGADAGLVGAFDYGQPTDLEHSLKEKYGVWSYTTEDDGKITKNYKSNARVELGLNLKGQIQYTYKDMKISTVLGLYTPYAWDKTKVYQDAAGDLYADLGNGKDFSAMQFVGYRDNNRRFGNFDVDWTVAFSYQFLKCLQVTLSTNLKYYNGVKIDKTYNKGKADEYTRAAERVQFQGILGLGVGYSF